MGRRLLLLPLPLQLEKKGIMALMFPLLLVVLLGGSSCHPRAALCDQVPRPEGYNKLKAALRTGTEWPDAIHLRTPDSSIKRNTAISDKLKMISNEQNDPGLMEEFKSDDPRTFFKKALSFYYDAPAAIIQSEHVVSLRAMESENAKILNAKGEPSDENTAFYEKLRKSFDQLFRCVSCLTEALDRQPHVMPAEQKLVYQGEPFEQSIHYSKSELIGLDEVMLIIYAVMVIAGWSTVKNLNIVVLALLLLVPSTCAQPVPDETVPPTRLIVLDARAESYVSFLNGMHTLLEANTLPELGHYFLPLEEKGAPSWWVNVQVSGDDINKKGLMYVRPDNIYILGFMNGDGTLYCVSDGMTAFTQGCTNLTFGGSYSELTGRGRTKEDLSPFMQREFLGRSAALYAANVLVEYGVTIHDKAEAKRALLIYCIMISEALRFKPIGNQVKETWLNPATLTVRQSRMIFAWVTMSKLFCRQEERPPTGWSTGAAKLTRAEMYTLQDISNALDLVKGLNVCMKYRKEKP